MAKKKAKVKEWPPEHQAVEEEGRKADGPTLAKTLSGLSGMNRDLAERMVIEGNWPAEAGEFAREYGLSQMDAEGVLEVLNVNRGSR